MIANGSGPTDLATLERWLRQADIDLSLWGVAGSKRVVDLWREIEAGESALIGPPLLRRVKVVIVHIYHNELQLIEAAQRFRDGRVRRRNRAPAEKMLPGESYQQAVLRCLAEELNVAAADVTLHPSSYRFETRTVDSFSYPGLPTRFELHTVEVSIANLPHADFCTFGVAEPHDPICGHIWRWAPRK